MSSKASSIEPICIKTTDLREWTYGSQRKNEGRDSQGVWDGHVHTAILEMDNQQWPIVQHRELRSVICGSLDARGVWERMDTCICVAKSLCCPPDTITILLISNTPMQNKKFKGKK